MNSSLSDDPIILSMSIRESGLSEVTIEDITKTLTLDDAITVITTAIPEIKDKVPSISDGSSAKCLTLFPRNVIKVHRDKDHISALLYSPMQRRPYYQKFKYSSEEDLGDFTDFMDSLHSILGDRNANVDLLFANLNIQVNMGEDPCKLTALNYLYPPICCQVSLIKRNNLYGVDIVKYVTPSNGVKREALSLPNYWITDAGSLQDCNKSWYGRVSLPNFFDTYNMCFGSIDKDDLLDYDARGAVILDQFLDCVYSSYFNTDLYHNAPLQISLSDTSTTIDIIVSAFLESLEMSESLKVFRQDSSIHESLRSAIRQLSSENRSLLAHIIQRTYHKMSKEHEERYYP